MCSAWTDVTETARLKLRPLAPADAARLAELADDWDVARQTGALPHPYGRADADAFIARQADAPDGERAFAVDRAGELAGVMGFHACFDGPWPEMGYWLGRSYWGAGLATEAARAGLGWARGRGWRAVAAGHFTDNPASGRVLEKAGFLYTGVRVAYPSVARGETADARRMIWLA